MKIPTRYQAKNTGPTRYGNHTPVGTPPTAAPKAKTPGAMPDAGSAVAANDATAAPAAADESPAEAVKVLAGAQARADALANVKSGGQILADTSRPAASTLPKS